jgi:glycosyltransferase involved in cell wall biosynthesis
LSKLTLVRLKLRAHFERAYEYLALDCAFCRKGVAGLGLVAGLLLLVCRRGSESLRVLAAVHRAAYMRTADRIIERLLARGFAGSGFCSPLPAAIGRHVNDTRLQAPPFTKDPRAMLGSLALVLRSPTTGSKGVIVLLYNYAFPRFAKAFDLPEISKRYHIVLEPSWSGCCTEDVLCYAGVPSCLVQTNEPRDRRFLEGLGVGFRIVPTSTNSWVDHRVFRPLPDFTKDVDLIMVAGWGGYKRHTAFFRALKRLQRLRPSIRVVLVGYSLGMSKDRIFSLAKTHDVAGLIEIFENLSQQEVNVQLNRARVNVLWSRKEGGNRAIVEGMFAGLPCIIREGFNYGHRYEFINQNTGAFSSERDLPKVALELIERAPHLNPRERILVDMSCQQSTKILDRAIGDHDVAPLAVKLNSLFGMEYWDPEDAVRFGSDHDYLSSHFIAT